MCPECAGGARERSHRRGESRAWGAGNADDRDSQTVISLELLTVLVVGPLACLVCYDIAKKNPRANILMTVIATAELYGGASGDRGKCPRCLGGLWGATKRALTKSQAS